MVLSASLSPFTAYNGTITFFDGVNQLGSSSVIGNVATWNWTSSSVGSHNIKATYSGDISHATSTNTITLTCSPGNNHFLSFDQH